MIIMLASSGDYTDRALVESWVAQLPAATTLICAGSNRGADHWAHKAATDRGLPVQVIKAEWRGPKDVLSGYARNLKMLEYLRQHPDEDKQVVAFLALTEKGTWHDNPKHAIRIAREADVPVLINQQGDPGWYGPELVPDMPRPHGTPARPTTTWDLCDEDPEPWLSQLR